MTGSPSGLPIVHMPLPWYEVQYPVTLICTGLGLIAGGSTFLELVHRNSWAFSTAMGLLLFVIFLGLGLYFRWSARREMQRRLKADHPTDSGVNTSSPDLRQVVTYLILPATRAIGDKRVVQRWGDFQAQCQRLGIPPPRTAIDSTLAERLGALERTAFGLEPEPILGSGDARGVWRWVSPGLVLAGTALIVFGELWHGLLMYAAALLWGFTSLPAIRDRLRIFRGDDGNIVAGMGSLRDERNRVWTTDNAMMVVQANSSSGSGLTVRIVGEPGEIKLMFNDENDPDFLKLWQRWNHPTPRPELVEP